ncbi:acyl-CoA thioesterase [Enterovirga aerilata]|uniref:acyl-CoA thioesterase n=1 Tax=Enterovirga aerilata TaxID=2730920 RepID=UPI003211E69B
MGFTHRRSLTVEWGHCDPAGIVFNPRYFEFFDWSTALLLEAALGLNKAAMMAEYAMAGTPVVDTRARFLAPARFGDVVEIASGIIGLGRSSFRVRHKLTNAGRLAVEGEETRVWTMRDRDHPERLRAEALPEAVAGKLRGG